MLLRTGRTDEAEAIIKKGYELDSFSPIITLNVGAIALVRGQYEEALSYLKKCIELDPSFAPGYGWTGVVYERMGKFEEAFSHLQKAVELSGRSTEYLSYLGHYYGVAGKRDEALKLIRETEDRYRAGTGAAYNVARIYAGLGEKEMVLDWLEKDYGDQSTWLSNLKIDYAWENVRSDPRFVGLMRKVGLVR